MPTAPAAVPLRWRTARGVVQLERPVILGILNVTPDSFWDGGRHVGAGAAVRHAERLLTEGADIIDIGGESTRPGAAPVSAADEIERVVPVVAAVTREFPHIPVSVDTVKADVAHAALDAGAAIVNDVSALRLDDALGPVIARAGAGVILMHSRGTVDRMARYEMADYDDDVVADVTRELRDAVVRAHTAGIDDDAIVLDPGFGFAKKTEHSLALLDRLDRIVELGYPVMVGPSRKRFIGEAGGKSLPVEERLEGTIAACVISLMRGARLFRVHDVGPVRRALDLAAATQASGAGQATTGAGQATGAGH